jgi:four helix bundle protein
MRSATSAGANFEEARGAESRPDFTHKLQLVLKELRESLYWLRLIIKAEFNLPKSCGTDEIIEEARQLANIVAKSVITAKQSR